MPELYCFALLRQAFDRLNQGAHCQTFQLRSLTHSAVHLLCSIASEEDIQHSAMSEGHQIAHITLLQARAGCLIAYMVE